MNYYPDQPILGNTTSPDMLNRKGFAKKIGKSILLESDSPGLVLSLEGPWGYGKTSVFNLIKKYLLSLDKAAPLIVNFNPWMIGTAETLVQEFLIQFASAIGLSDKIKKVKDTAKQVLAYSNIFSPIRLIPGAEPWASLIKGVLQSVGQSAEEIGDVRELNIESKRNKVIEALKKIDKPIIVFIDDLDRLPPSEVFQMVRLVKAIADFPKVAFLLAFDPQHIEDSLRNHGISDAKLYLDKIVQVRLHLPLIDPDDLIALTEQELTKLGIDQLTGIFPDDADRFGEFYHFAIKHLISTPRDLYRILNRIRQYVGVNEKEVAFSDFFALETIAIAAPEVYDHIRSNPGAYTGHSQDEYPYDLEKPEERVAKSSDERNAVIGRVASGKIIYIKELLSKLFPLIKGINIGQRYSRSSGHVAFPD